MMIMIDTSLTTTYNPPDPPLTHQSLKLLDDDDGDDIDDYGWHILNNYI